MIKDILNFPLVYKLSQKIFLADNFRKKVLHELLNDKIDRILDIGCGPGNMIKYISFNDYYGFDTDINYINYAKKKYNSCNFFCELFTEHSLKKIKKVDVVLLFGLLHHLTNDEVIKLIEVIKLSLNHAGKIIVLDPVFINNQNFIAKFLIKNDRGLYVRNEEGYMKLFEHHKLNFKYKIYHQKIVPYTWIVTEIKC
jgi:SAM-dependent methyltransferase